MRLSLLLALPLASSLLEWLYPRNWQQCPDTDAGHLVDGKEWAKEVAQERLEQASQKVKQGAEQVKEKIKGGAEQVKTSVKKGAEKAKATVREGAEKAKATVKDTTAKAKATLQDTAEYAKFHEVPRPWARLWDTLLHREPHNLIVRSRPEAYLVYLDVPGIPQSDLNLTLEPTDEAIITMHLHGHHRSCIKEDSQVCLEREIDHRFNLPEDAKVEGIKAWLKDGILMIKLARQPQVQQARVPVEEWRAGWGERAKRVLERVTGHASDEDEFEDD